MAAELNRFVFYGEWLDNLESLPLEKQDQIIAEIVRYGVGKSFQHANDSAVMTIVNFTKGAIDKSKENYRDKVQMNKKKKDKVNERDRKIYELWNKNQALKSDEIAKILGISKSAVDHSDGWRFRRDNKRFMVADD